MKIVFLYTAIVVVALAGFVGGSMNTSAPGWVGFSQAEAGPHRRSVRRTSRRTARRTSRRHSHHHHGVAVGAAVVAAIAIGTIVATLPPSCSTLIVNGVTYHNCSGTYYAPSGSQWVVVTAP